LQAVTGLRRAPRHRFRSSKKRKGGAPGRARNLLAELKAFFRWAVAEGARALFSAMAQPSRTNYAMYLYHCGERCRSLR